MTKHQALRRGLASGRFGLVALLCLAAALGLLSCRRKPPVEGQVLRVGFGDPGPYADVAEDGGPGGVIVDLIDEAARRRSIKIRWIRLEHETPDEALARGTVDVWPIMSATPGRLKVVHITKPWFQNGYYLFARKDTGYASPRDVVGKTVAHHNRAKASEMAHSFLPGAILTSRAEIMGVVNAVCSGEADAGFLDARTLEDLLQREPESCNGLPLKVHLVKGAISLGGIGARKEFAAVVDELRWEISDLLSEGEFSSTVEKWSPSSAGEIQSLFAFQQAEMKLQFYLWGFGGLLLICAILLFTAVAALAARATAERAKATEASRGEILRRMGTGEPLDSILGAVPEIITTALPHSTCAVWLCDCLKLVCVAASDAGPGPSSRIIPQSIQSGATIVARAALHAREEWLSEEEPAKSKPRPRTALAIPIFGAGTTVLGVLEIQSRKRFCAAGDQVSIARRTAQLAAVVIENNRLHGQLEQQATHDKLTGVANRWLFLDRLDRALEDARARTAALTLLYMDLDRFKPINDAFGHRIGDLYLVEAAARIRSCLRKFDLVSRMGGDEFTALLPDVNAREAEHVAGRIVEALRRPFVLDGCQVFGSVSIGVSSYPKDGTTAEDLQRCADLALYCAKNLGKNQYHLASPSLASQASEMHQLEHDLKQALQRHEFEAHYQPQFTNEGELAGVEALLRFRHPKLGLLLPDTFIPVAEEIGLIAEIDAWVLNEACRQSSLWRRKGFAPVRVSVNASPVDLAQVDFIDRIALALASYGLEPSALQVELTEGTVMKSSDESLKSLHRLKKMGVSIALDDFGTGYSSLSCLHRLPIDTVKIDKSFVRDLTLEGGSRPLLEAVFAVARALGISVIAEGVENEEQRRLLRLMGCNLFQGYYFSRPLTAADVEALLDKQKVRARLSA